MLAVAVDLGGTYLRCGLVVDSGDITAVSRVRIRSFLDGVPADKIWRDILNHIAAYTKSKLHILGRGLPIVFSFPGPIQDGKRVIGAPTVVGGDQHIPDIARRLTAITGRRVFIINDISAAAWHFSRNQKLKRFMVITVSSGVGSKVFDRRHPEGVLDDVSYCGEIGHMVVDVRSDAPVCDCGGSGHLGAIASGRGVERLARTRALAHRADFERSACARVFGASPSSLSNEQHIVPAALLGDEWALNLIRSSIDPLAAVLLSVTLAVGLEKIIVIGGFALSLGATYVGLLRQALLRRSTPAPFQLKVANLVQLGRNDVEACLRGAAAFAASHRLRRKEE